MLFNLIRCQLIDKGNNNNLYILLKEVLPVQINSSKIEDQTLQLAQILVGIEVVYNNLTLVEEVKLWLEEVVHLEQ